VGDEAKGKIVDLLTAQNEIVVRYQGGANAGHTVVADGQTYKLSLVPSGIFRPQVQCVVACGVVINPASLLAEIDGLVKRGVKIGKNLMISDRAHVIFPWHIEEDRLLNDRCAGGEAIGTTLRGLGRATGTRSAGRSPCVSGTCIATASAVRSSKSPRRSGRCWPDSGRTAVGCNWTPKRFTPNTASSPRV